MVCPVYITAAYRKRFSDCDEWMDGSILDTLHIITILITNHDRLTLFIYF
jgi:hypothetical protein